MRCPFCRKDLRARVGIKRSMNATDESVLLSGSLASDLEDLILIDDLEEELEDEGYFDDEE